MSANSDRPELERPASIETRFQIERTLGQGANGVVYQVVDRVQAMRFVPLDRVNVTMVAVASLVPFAPVALMAVPFDTLLTAVMGMLV